MRRGISWLLALVVALAAVVGLIAIFNSRDQSGVDQHASVTAGPGEVYKGEPVLSPGLQDAVKRGNVVVLYRDAKPPAGIQALVPPGGKALADAGQSVVIDREPTLKAPLAALSSKKIQQVDTPEQLRAFIDYWLGGR
ncbi:MAG: hypothetical protein QOJ29_5228 [Thermoleophilaceae bacterium]|jgi:hypothetical protein|nr:hypothetical protein [Thermoleophilaceae bacterium]